MSKYYEEAPLSQTFGILMWSILKAVAENIFAAGLTGADDLKKARKRDIDKKHREKFKQDKIKNKRKLEELAKENDDLRNDNISMNNTVVQMKQQLQSQEEEMRQLKKKHRKLQSKLSKRLAFSKDINLHHETENVIPRIQINNPSSLIIKELQVAQAKIRQLESEKCTLKVINTALSKKILRRAREQ